MGRFNLVQYEEHKNVYLYWTLYYTVQHLLYSTCIYHEFMMIAGDASMSTGHQLTDADERWLSSSSESSAGSEAEADDERPDQKATTRIRTLQLVYIRVITKIMKPEIRARDHEASASVYSSCFVSGKKTSDAKRKVAGKQANGNSGADGSSVVGTGAPKQLTRQQLARAARSDRQKVRREREREHARRGARKVLDYASDADEAIDDAWEYDEQESDV